MIWHALDLVSYQSWFEIIFEWLMAIPLFYSGSYILLFFYWLIFIAMVYRAPDVVLFLSSSLYGVGVTLGSRCRFLLFCVFFLQFYTEFVPFLWRRSQYAVLFGVWNRFSKAFIVLRVRCGFISKYLTSLGVAPYVRLLRCLFSEFISVCMQSCHCCNCILLSIDGTDF